jgi:hypothetical protein
VGLLRFLWFSANKSIPKKTLFYLSRNFVKAVGSAKGLLENNEGVYGYFKKA